MANVLFFYLCPTHGVWEYLGSSTDAIRLIRPCPKCKKTSELTSDEPAED